MLAAGIGKPVIVKGLAKPVVIALAPIHLASMNGNIQAISKLIEHGADQNILSSNGLTPLHWAAACGQVSSIEELINKQADLEAVNDSHYTVLMAAADQGQESAIRFLVDVMNDVNEQDSYGETALMYAVRDNHLASVEALVEAGADITVENNDGETAWSIALSRGYSGIVKVLETPSLPFHQPKKTASFRQPRSSHQAELQTSLLLAKDANALNLSGLFSRLSSLTGLVNIKAEVTQLVNFLRVQQMRKQKGLSVPEQSLHMVFTGNPGTGKTTIARLIAQIYRSMGILSKGQFVETDRAGLVGGYLGQTAIKTQEVIESALGGVLFIDEAYSLTDSTHGHDLYGQEAVATLLKMMEDHRDDLIVIVAGYTEPMQKFIRSNPGLQSRFNKFLHFDDYAPAELTEIFGHFAAQGDYKLHPATELKLHNVFADLYAARDETFGNARLARNMFEKAINAHANRMVSAGAVDEVSLVTLYPEDIPNG